SGLAKPYARLPERVVKGSSGFEHVFMAEHHTLAVGFHNWWFLEREQSATPRRIEYSVSYYSNSNSKDCQPWREREPSRNSNK
ncbi:Poly(U)-specific endoribonuclease, partial [Orchesella cincta]